MKECPESPNCVSTETKQKSKKMDPLGFSNNSENAKEAIKRAIAKMPRTKLVKEEENYLHYVFTSAIMRYKDDVEFFINGDEKKIHFRSASRTGYSDLGANRSRMENISKILASELK